MKQTAEKKKRNLAPKERSRSERRSAGADVQARAAGKSLANSSRRKAQRKEREGVGGVRRGGVCGNAGRCARASVRPLRTNGTRTHDSRAEHPAEHRKTGGRLE